MYQILSFLAIFAGILSYQWFKAAQEDYADNGFSVKTGNPVTDVIISEKQKEALEKGVEFSCNFSFPAVSNFSTYDISVILGNILSNAMEAAESSNGKKVKVSGVVKDQIYFIDVKNSFDGVLDIDEVTGLPLSTKATGEGHGYGLRNVKKVAEKYYGAVEIKQVDGEVWTTVMMVLPM